MEKEFKFKKIILWNIGIYFGISIPLFVGISYYSPITEMAGMNFLFFLYFTLGFQVFINFVLSLCSVMMNELYLAGSFLLSTIVVLLIEILILCLIGVILIFF